MSPPTDFGGLSRIVVGTDHGGYELKLFLVEKLRAAGYSVLDVGTFSSDSCDYPLIGAKVAQAVSGGKGVHGLLLCKSGAGMAIVANKFPHVRAAVCSSVALAKHTRRHNDANILVLGAEQVSERQSAAILKAWLATSFEGGRHARRIRQIERIEKKILCKSL